MRLLFLFSFYLLQIQASEPVLSALLGELISEKKITVGETLILGENYQVANKSKVQLLINNNSAITLASGSHFKIDSCDTLTCKLYFDNATAKIFTLATTDKSTSLEIQTPHGFIKIHDSIALIKTTSSSLKVACAKHSLSLIYDNKTTQLKEDEMLTLQNNTLTIEPSVYDDFNEVFIEKNKTIQNEVLIQEYPLDDPSDLDN
jgi:hypothetical protein